MIKAKESVHFVQIPFFFVKMHENHKKGGKILTYLCNYDIMKL